jgi:hypothetical protein
MLKLSISVSTALFVAFATFYSGVAEALPVAYHSMNDDGDLWVYPTLTDLANATNYTLLSNTWAAHAMTYDGNVFTAVGADVWTYPTLADLAADTNYTLLGTAYTGVRGLAFNGSDYIVVHGNGSVYSYPTLNDFVSEANYTFIGSGYSGGDDINGLLYNGSVYVTITNGGEVYSYPTLINLATDTGYTHLGQSAANSRALLFVPEPSTALMIFLGLAVLSQRRLRYGPRVPLKGPSSLVGA